MHENLLLDCVRETDRIVAFIRQTLSEALCSRLVVGISGGIDSALVAALGARAVGADNVLGVFLPYCTSNPSSKEHGMLVADWLGIPRDCFEITNMVQPLLAAFPDMSARRLGNIMARCRMVVLFDQSIQFNGLVAGTGNRTETLLGYFTMHGDGAAALKPIAHLYKHQVRQLAQYLCIPQVIIDKAPSADLWQGQTDEGELGFTYHQADEVLYLLSECHWSAKQIAVSHMDLAVAHTIHKRMIDTTFKRQTSPTLSPANPIIFPPVATV
ncbi:MAG: NAD+ synthase [Anaerolineae bacterium]